jgi:hypothetical protein
LLSSSVLCCLMYVEALRPADPAPRPRTPTKCLKSKFGNSRRGGLGFPGIGEQRGKEIRFCASDFVHTRSVTHLFDRICRVEGIQSKCRLSKYTLCAQS